MQPSTRHLVGCAAATVIQIGLGAAAFGQSSEFKLDESRQWSTVASPEPGSDAWTIAETRRLLALDNPSAAFDIIDPWIEKTRRTGSPYLPEALLLRGDSLLAQDREFKALYDYEEVCKKHRESDAFPVAVERELEIALLYVNGLKLRSLGFRWQDPEDLLVELLIRVQERLPRSQAAEKAAITLADYYYDRRDLSQAFDMYDLYLQNFPTGPNEIKARQRRIQSDIGRFKGPRYNAAELINARVQVQDFVKRYPTEAAASGINEALIARLDESMAAQLLDTGKWYLKVGDRPSAKVAFKRLRRDHPLTLSAERAEAIMLEQGWVDEVGPPAPAEYPAPPATDEVVEPAESESVPAADAPSEPSSQEPKP